MQFQALKAVILNRLEGELSTSLHYHSVRHTLDVLSVCEARAKTIGLSEEDAALLFTAAVLHDAGFLYSKTDHEMAGGEIAKEVLPDFGYDQDQISQIIGMILATKIPQSPDTQLEEIICDADLDYLGREDFYTIGQTLYLELKELGVVSSEKEWDDLQIKFLTNHTYHTDISIREREPQKNSNPYLIKNFCTTLALLNLTRNRMKKTNRGCLSFYILNSD